MVERSLKFRVSSGTPEKVAIFKAKLEKEFPNSVVVERDGQITISPRPTKADSSPAGVTLCSPPTPVPRETPGRQFYAIGLVDRNEVPIGWVIVDSDRCTELMTQILRKVTGFNWKGVRK